MSEFEYRIEGTPEEREKELNRLLKDEKGLASNIIGKKEVADALILRLREAFRPRSVMVGLDFCRVGRDGRINDFGRYHGMTPFEANLAYQREESDRTFLDRRAGHFLNEHLPRYNQMRRR